MKRCPNACGTRRPQKQTTMFSCAVERQRFIRAGHSDIQKRLLTIDEDVWCSDHVVLICAVSREACFLWDLYVSGAGKHGKNDRRKAKPDTHHLRAREQRRLFRVLDVRHSLLLFTINRRRLYLRSRIKVFLSDALQARIALSQTGPIRRIGRQYCSEHHALLNCNSTII